MHTRAINKNISKEYYLLLEANWNCVVMEGVTVLVNII